jgi:hypothetical protein
MMRQLIACLLMLVSLACSSTPPRDAPASRVATFNASLNRERPGQLLEDLTAGTDPQLLAVVEIIQRTRPDVLLINEFDYDAGNPDAAPKRLIELLAKGVAGQEGVAYPYFHTAAVNTGVHSGFDLDRSGLTEFRPGTRDYGGDAWGFGSFPGQYGMLLLSRYPIDRSGVRTFQKLRWKDMPEALLPTDPKTLMPWYSAQALESFPLSSKSHWDVPVKLPGGRVLHVLCSHPTPPVFDGPEDRNGRRNHDEIRFWTEYLTPPKDPSAPEWIRDDAGKAGRLDARAAFVLLGDLNNDPEDGSGLRPAVRNLLAHPRLLKSTAPAGPGGVAAATQGGANTFHKTPALFDTADFTEPSPGNLRVDYVLPGGPLVVLRSGIFWPAPEDPASKLTAMSPRPASSDHRLVWVDIVAK